MASVATKVLDFEGKLVEFTILGQEPFQVALDDFSPETQLHLALHGISQKLGDSYSGCKGDIKVALELFKATLAQLKNGEWRAARGEGESKPRITELAEAIARIKGLDISAVTAHLVTSSDDEKKAMRNNDRVKAVIAVIRAEKAQARLDKLDAELPEGGGVDALAGFTVTPSGKGK